VHPTVAAATQVADAVQLGALQTAAQVRADRAGQLPRLRHQLRILRPGDNIEERAGDGPAAGVIQSPCDEVDRAGAEEQVAALDAHGLLAVEPVAGHETSAGALLVVDRPAEEYDRVRFAQDPGGGWRAGSYQRGHVAVPDPPEQVLPTDP